MWTPYKLPTLEGRESAWCCNYGCWDRILLHLVPLTIIIMENIESSWNILMDINFKNSSEQIF